MVSEPDRGDETVTFTRALARLKREGSNLLVVGSTSDEAHTAVCDRLLGDAIGGRRRMVVSTERGGCVSHTPADAERVRYETTTRSAAAAAPTADGPDLDGDRVQRLSALGTAVAGRLDADDGFDPAEFRLCLDSLRPLLEEHSERELFRFLHAVTNEVRAVRGMAHYHLPVAYDNPTVDTLKPLFDAVIEVRSGPDGPQQRWHLCDADAGTEWLSL